MPEPTVAVETEPKQEPAPAPKAESTPAPAKNKIEVDEAEYTRIKKQANKEGFNYRRIEEQLKQLQEERDALKERVEAIPPEDADQAELELKFVKRNRELAEREKRVQAIEQAREVEKSALEWAEKYDLDAAIFATCKSPGEVKEKALEAHVAQVDAERHTPKKLDVGAKGAVSGHGYTPTPEQIRAASIEEYQANIKSGKWVMSRAKK